MDAPKDWDEVQQVSHLSVIPQNCKKTRKYYHVYGRRSSDFAVLSRDFEINGDGPKAERLARQYIDFLRGRQFDQIKAEFRTETKVTLGLL